jgi:DNA repair exonuclease SbcCD ATPase subunit
MDRVLMTLTPEQIARLRQLHWLATKHWSASIGMDALVLRADGSRMVIGDAIYHPEWALDAELIAASRNALPELLDELERLRADRAEQAEQSLAALRADEWQRTAGDRERRIDTLTLELSAERQRREQAERQLERAKLDLTNALNPDAVLGYQEECLATVADIQQHWETERERAEHAEQSIAALREQIADLLKLIRDCVDAIDRRELTGLSVPDQRAVRNTLFAALPPAPKET